MERIDANPTQGSWETESSLDIRREVPKGRRNGSSKLGTGLLIAAGLLVAGGGVAMILMGRNIIPIDLNGYGNLVLGLGAGAAALGVGAAAYGVFSAVRRARNEKAESYEKLIDETPLKTLTLKVVSFNVGSRGDWENLAAREDLKKSENWEISVMTPRQEAIGKMSQVRIPSQDLKRRESEKVTRQMGALMDLYDPDIIAMQEYYGNIKNDDEYTTLKNLLTTRGYTISSGKDCVVAYKTASFSSASEATIKTAAEITDLPKVMTLTHAGTNMKIKVASHHVAGFNGVQQKQQTLQRREDPNSSKKDERQMVRGTVERQNILAGNPRTSGGDLDLERALAGIEDGTENLIIHGLDSNTTSKDSSENPAERLHPVRMRLFEYAGYDIDPSKSPTIRDGNDFQARKYDFIAAKAKASNVQIEEVTIQGVNNKELLDQPGQSMSDHLPVLANVTFQG